MGKHNLEVRRAGPALRQRSSPGAAASKGKARPLPAPPVQGRGSKKRDQKLFCSTRGVLWVDTSPSAVAAPRAPGYRAVTPVGTPHRGGEKSWLQLLEEVGVLWAPSYAKALHC